MKTIQKETIKLKTKRTFLKKGTCSKTFCFILNREFGHTNDEYETACDPLAGGIIQQGYQCGMLWGASVAAGAEAYRRLGNTDKGIAIAVKATQDLIESFQKRAKTTECEEITDTDWSRKNSILKYMIRGKMITCFRLAGKWAPEAIETAQKAFAEESPIPQNVKSCASEVVRNMGGSDEEIVMVAGFAGGLGLSGSGCGALAAAIWIKTLEKVRKGEWKYTPDEPVIQKILEQFYEASDYEIECSKICGKKFETVEEHSEFINNEGCKKLIETFAEL